MPKTLIVDASAGFSGSALLGLPRDLAVHEAQELEPRVHPGQVELHPLLVDHAAAVGELVSLRPRERTSSSCRSIIPARRA